MKKGRIVFKGNWIILILLMIVFFPLGIVYGVAESEIQIEE